MLTTFIWTIRTRNFYWLLNVSQKRLWIIILSSNRQNMVWSSGAVAVLFRDIPQRHFFSMLLFIHFWKRTQKLMQPWTIFIPHATSCGGNNVFDPSVSQSVSPSVLFFLLAQLLWNRSTEFLKLCSYEGHNV